MIVPEEELVNYLGNDVNSLEGKIKQATLEKLRRYDAHTIEEFSLPAIDYIFLAHQKGTRSLRALAKEVRISHDTLCRVFDFYGLPTMTQAEGVRRN